MTALLCGWGLLGNWSLDAEVVGICEFFVWVLRSLEELIGSYLIVDLNFRLFPNPNLVALQACEKAVHRIICDIVLLEHSRLLFCFLIPTR